TGLFIRYLRQSGGMRQSIEAAFPMQLSPAARRGLCGIGSVLEPCPGELSLLSLRIAGLGASMARLQLSFSCWLYDRMQPVYSGEVKVDGIDLNFIAIDEPRPIFDRMSGGEEFDVAEYSSSEFVQRFANRQCPFVALPVFPSRAFRHGFIAVNRKAGIKTPNDLEGKRVGIPLLTMS